MSDMESHGGSGGETGGEELRQQLKTLQSMFTIVLVLLIGLCVGASYFLEKQIQFQKTGEAQMEMIVGNFPLAAAADFQKRLQEYAKTHPDFKSVASKYPGIFGPQATLAAPPAGGKK